MIQIKASKDRDLFIRLIEATHTKLTHFHSEDHDLYQEGLDDMRYLLIKHLKDSEEHE
jgi:hypothetical protein